MAAWHALVQVGGHGRNSHQRTAWLTPAPLWITAWQQPSLPAPGKAAVTSRAHAPRALLWKRREGHVQMSKGRDLRSAGPVLQCIVDWLLPSRTACLAKLTELTESAAYNPAC